MFDWQDLQHFVVVARLGSLTAAAKQLRVDQATVGRRIASLEAATGMKLIDRLPRSSRLTVDGKGLAEASLPMDEAAQSLQRHIRAIATPLSGIVVISALPALATVVIAPSLTAFLKKYPGLKVVLSATSNIAALGRGEADIAIGLVRPEATDRVAQRIGILRLGLYATGDYAKLPPGDWRFIGFEDALEHIQQHRWLARFAGDRAFSLRSSDVMTQFEAARAGIGVAILPCFLTDRDTGLVKIASTPEPPARSIWMSVHRDMRRSPAVRATMEHLIEVMSFELGE